MKASDILTAGAGHLKDREATYDQPGGERSIPNVVTAFNALTGHALTAEQGWLFLVLLKVGRTQQGAYRADNYEDGAAYFALMGEQAADDRATATPLQAELAPPSDVQSEDTATHREPGGVKMKRCAITGRWLKWGSASKSWFFASADKNYETQDLIKLRVQPKAEKAPRVWDVGTRLRYRAGLDTYFTIGKEYEIVEVGTHHFHVIDDQGDRHAWTLLGGNVAFVRA